MTFEEKVDIDGKKDNMKELTSTAPKEEEQGFYIGSIFFSSKDGCLPTTTPATNVVNGSKDIEQPLNFSSSGEKENISSNLLTEVETTCVAGEEAEIVFNNESTEIETGLSETGIIEPISHDDVVVVFNETRVLDHSGEKTQPIAVGRQDGVANPSSCDATDQHKTVSTGAKKPSSWADEVESISNNSLTEVETTCVAGEEAEIVFNNESTETETAGSSLTEIIEPISHDDIVVVVVNETRVLDHSGEKTQPIAVGRQDGVANPSNCDATDQHKTVSAGAKKPSSWVDGVENASDGESSETVSPANQTLTEVDEAINTSSKSERVEHVCHVGEVRGVSTSAFKNNWGNKSSFTFNRVVENIPRQQPIVRQRDNDDKIGEQVGFTLLQLDEMNRKKDVVRMEIETKKITVKESRDKYEAAKSEQNIAYDVLNAKRQELDSVQSTLNMIKNAVLVKQTADKVRNMHHRLEHETIYSIQEEKRLMRELKQLEAYHRELLSIVERQTKPQPSFDEKEPLERRFKALKEELDSAKKELLRIKSITNAARKMYFDENGKLNEMQSQLKAANVFCKEAYANVQNLKRQLFKNKYFRMYKDDDFRNKYLKSNPMSTLALAVARRKAEDDKIVTLSTSTEKLEMTTEDDKHSQEEEELPREDKALPKENNVVKSREESLAEEKAKAKKAEDRKKCNAEEAKARAELMEQREAKRRQKEKAKKDRKKARRKAQKGIVEGESLVSSTDQDPSLELITQEQEPEVSEKPIVQELPRTKEKTRSKKSKRSSVLTKTNGVVSPPLPKNRTMQLWKQVMLSAPLVVAASVVCLPWLHHFL